MIRKDKALEDKITPFKLPIRYALLAKKLVIKGENRKGLLDLMTRFLKENDLQTEVENILCEKIITSLWKLQRASVIERNLLNQQNEIPRYSSTNWNPDEIRKRVRNIKKVRIGSSEIQNIIHYQFELERSLEKALKKLREEQSTRGSMQNNEK